MNATFVNATFLDKVTGEEVDECRNDEDEYCIVCANERSAT
jgi:hypothetical protein